MSDVIGNKGLKIDSYWTKSTFIIFAPFHPSNLQIQTKLEDPLSSVTDTDTD